MSGLVSKKKLTMEIRLDLSRYCIETAAKKKYETLILAYFRHPTPEAEQAIDALKHFLEQGDFSELRTRFQAFRPKEAVLIIPGSLGDMRIGIMDEQMAVPWKNKPRYCL